MSAWEVPHFLQRELKHEATANCLGQPGYRSGKAGSSKGSEITVVLRIWAELAKEMRLEPSPIKMLVINLASTIPCFLTVSGSWQLVLPS